MILRAAAQVEEILRKLVRWQHQTRKRTTA
jgi:hypothetical protein